MRYGPAFRSALIHAARKLCFRRVQAGVPHRRPIPGTAGHEVLCRRFRHLLAARQGDGPIVLSPGDCYILPHGRPFQLATDTSVETIDYASPQAKQLWSTEEATEDRGGCLLIGGHFVLTGPQAELLLRPLPPVIHIKDEPGKAAMRFSLNRMKDEVAEVQPGSSLVVQQLAYAMLIHALRLYLDKERKDGTGWLFALTDKQLSDSLTRMHRQPERTWTLQDLATSVGMSRSGFALRFKQTVGSSPMEYLTRWRMLLATKELAGSSKGLIEIASSLGYESESAFGKAFKRVMGTSATQYRRHA